MLGHDEGRNRAAALRPHIVQQGGQNPEAVGRAGRCQTQEAQGMEAKGLAAAIRIGQFAADIPVKGAAGEQQKPQEHGEQGPPGGRAGKEQIRLGAPERKKRQKHQQEKGCERQEPDPAAQEPGIGLFVFIHEPAPRRSGRPGIDAACGVPHWQSGWPPPRLPFFRDSSGRARLPPRN